MMIRGITIMLMIALLSGCATCERHKTVCTVGMMLLIGSIAIAANSHGSRSHQPDHEVCNSPLVPNFNSPTATNGVICPN